MGTDRGRMVVALDDDTHERWRALARAHGVTLSALVEALGRQIDPDRIPPLLRQAIVEARAIQAERFDRRHVGPA